MSAAILRGFDFLEDNVDEELRFCNPLLSFESDDLSPIYFARDLDWVHHDDDPIPSLTLVDRDEISSFATLTSGGSFSIAPNEGVMLMGHRFSNAAHTAGINIDGNSLVTLTASVDSRCRIGIASVATYRQFASQIAREAVSVFDRELQATAVLELPKAAEAALFVLRKCGLTRPTDLAIRHLVAAHVTRQVDMYRRLLTRYSFELKDTEDNLHRRAERHIDVLRCERLWHSTPHKFAQIHSPDWFRHDPAKERNRWRPLTAVYELQLSSSVSNIMVQESVAPVFGIGSFACVTMSKKLTEDQTKSHYWLADWSHDAHASLTIQASIGTVGKIRPKSGKYYKVNATENSGVKQRAELG